VSNQSLITCPSDTLQPVIMSEAQALKEQALAGVALIGKISSMEENQAAVVAVAEVTKLRKLITASHKQAKEPFLRVCQALDRTRNEFDKELAEEEMRVNRICGDYQQEELEKVREKERERQRELGRIERERKAEEERTRREAEELAAKTKSSAKKAEILKQAEAKIEEQQQLSVQAAEAVGPQAELAKTAGQSVKPVWTFEVTDIWKLVRARPDLVNITPATARINETIALGTREIAGLKIFEQVKTHVRPGSLGQKWIDV
jgi:hypothetical protein